MGCAGPPQDPVAGLMSDRPLENVASSSAARESGSPLPNPFRTVPFLALPVIPALRLTDRGLVDAERLCLVPLFGAD